MFFEAASTNSSLSEFDWKHNTAGLANLSPGLGSLAVKESLTNAGTWHAITGNHGDVGSLAATVEIAAVTPMPEPGTLLLGTWASLGGIGGWWARRKGRGLSVKSPENALV